MNIPASCLRQAITIRLVEERLLELYALGEVHGTVHTCVGQEWSGVAVCAALRKGDTIFSNHRGHGHFLSWCDDVEGLIGEILGRSSGVCGGWGGSQHLAVAGFFSNGIVGGMGPVSAGAAMAHKLRGGGDIAVLFIGDGGMNQGVVFETFNAASRFDLPLLIVCEINGIAQSTAIDTVLAGSLAGRAASFDIDIVEGDTWHPEALLASAQRAVTQVRSRSRPVLLCVHTFRLNPHSKGDDLRPRALLDDYRQRDLLCQWFAAADGDIHTLRESCRMRVERAVQNALAAPMACGIETPFPARADVIWRPAVSPGGSLVTRLRNGWEKALSGDSRVLFLGEDVADPYGGAFKVSKGLSSRFPERVYNMPISEAAMVGLGVGLALSGLRPVIEIMFGDFLTLAFDQLCNHAAKFHDMYGGRFHVPLVVRTPMGGRRGYGPTHSQSLEKHFLGIPGLQVAAIHHRLDCEAMLSRLPGWIQHPLLLIENKTAYGLDGAAGVLEGFVYQETGGLFPTLRIHPGLQPDVLIFGYGGMLVEIEAAMDRLFVDHDVLCAAIVPTMLHPFDMDPVFEALRETHRMVIVEEGAGFAGLGAEVVAMIHERGVGPVRIKRLSGIALAIPAAVSAEATHLPDARAIVGAVLAMMHGR
ncbi:MAG: pyruvate dehydrogenase [Magnetococcales bacterium]|nr:pyruvate dehydrogenase [Magnetococcales bacterium]